MEKNQHSRAFPITKEFEKISKPVYQYGCYSQGGLQIFLQGGSWQTKRRAGIHIAHLDEI